MDSGARLKIQSLGAILAVLNGLAGYVVYHLADRAFHGIDGVVELILGGGPPIATIFIMMYFHVYIEKIVSKAKADK